MKTAFPEHPRVDKSRQPFSQALSHSHMEEITTALKEKGNTKGVGLTLGKLAEIEVANCTCTCL